MGARVDKRNILCRWRGKPTSGSVCDCHESIKGVGMYTGCHLLDVRAGHDIRCHRTVSDLNAAVTTLKTADDKQRTTPTGTP